MSRSNLLHVAVGWLCCALAPATGQVHQHGAGEIDRLGTVSFPTSCSAAVAPVLEKGVALLHSFGYDLARQQFQQVEAREPACAIAYWGDAMTHYHQLWDRPSAKDIEAGRTLTRKAQRASAGTEREQGYITAAAAFYDAPPNATYEQRSVAYSAALAKLHERFPNDHEATTFYALSLLATPHANDNDFADRKKAVTLLNQILQDGPDHPGVAHYLIHACDNPEMAQAGLPAARRYAQIAPASPHALHMPSHIFTRLGLWADDIESNLASKAAAERQKETESRTHAMSFLEYAYLQTGETGRAEAIVREALSIPASEYKEPEYAVAIQVRFRSLLALETRNWTQAIEMAPPASAAPDFQATVYWAQAVAAGRLKNAKAAEAAAAKYEAALEAVKKTTYAYVAETMLTNREEAHAWAKFAQGNLRSAEALLREAAAAQDKAGKAEVDIPAREMLADMLLSANRPADALQEYQRSVTTDPGRFNGLFGIARAAQASGRMDLAREYFQKLLDNCPKGSRPELEMARNVLKGGSSADHSTH